MSAVTSLEEVGDRIRSVVDDALKPPLLVEARAWANEVDIGGARRSQERALEAYRNAQTAQRQAQAAETDAQEACDQAVSEAEWDLAGQFVVEANKTYLVIEGGESSPVKRQMTADEKRSWIATEAQKRPEVRLAAAKLRKARDATLAAKDEITHAGLRVSAAKHELDAAVAELQLLAAAIPHRQETPR